MAELDTIVGQYRVDLIGNGSNQIAQKLAGNGSGSSLMQFGEGELGSPIDGYEEMEFSFSGLHLGNIEMRVPNRVSFEFLL